MDTKATMVKTMMVGVVRKLRQFRIDTKMRVFKVVQLLANVEGSL